MTPTRALLEHRAKAIPWSPGWALVLDAYLTGAAMFPDHFANRRPA